jgi:hypothetical protein
MHNVFPFDWMIVISSSTEQSILLYMTLSCVTSQVQAYFCHQAPCQRRLAVHTPAPDCVQVVESNMQITLHRKTNYVGELLTNIVDVNCITYLQVLKNIKVFLVHIMVA